MLENTIEEGSEGLSFRKVTHVIFDMDGLLLDTERIYSEITQKIINPYGKQLTWEIISQLMGLQIEEEARRVIDFFGLPMTAQEYLDLQKKESIVAMSDCSLLPDTEQLYSETTQKIIDPYGKTLTWQVKSQLMGLHREEVAKKIVEIFNLPLTWQEYVEMQQEKNALIMPNCNFLPDTEGIYEGIVRDICKKYNKEVPLDVRMKILGTTEQRTAEIAVGDLKLPIEPSEFQQQHSTLGRLRLGNAPLLKGAEQLVRHLHANNIPIALATSSGSDSVEVKTQKHKALFDLFHHKVMGSSDPDVKVGKPAPDIFLVCASRFPDKPKPEQCLVFEDAPNGVRAAVDAGMQVVMVPDVNVTEKERSLATLVLSSLESTPLEAFGLPPLRDN